MLLVGPNLQHRKKRHHLLSRIKMHTLIIVIMYSFMCYFSKMEHTAHCKAKSKTQSQQTSTSTHTCGHTRGHTHTHTHTYAHTHMHTYAHTHTRGHTHTHTHTYAHTHMHTRTHTHAYTRAHTHTHTYIHIHTHPSPNLPNQNTLPLLSATLPLAEDFFLSQQNNVSGLVNALLPLH